MYKYLVDYLGGDMNVEWSNSKVAALKKIHDKFKVKPYLVARLKLYKPTSIKGNEEYHEIARYQMKFDPETGKHRFEHM
jgi:ribosomal protein L37E